ncbi:DUF4386 domain-containing protein [Streptomyces caeni]|uniref:DUF4386 domain-containing protein n=1 Tax=Streptomyces caeni TaxID=2307231 RepID=A0ABW4J3C6_9ACTN
MGDLVATARLARVTGALYLLLAGLGMLGPLTLESLVVPGDGGATAENIARSQALFDWSLGAWLVIVAVDIAVSVTLYLLLAPAGRRLSILAAAFRLVYSTALGALLAHLFTARGLLAHPAADGPQATAGALTALETFSAGFLVALVFFGVHLVLLGTLLHRSRYTPRIFGLLLVAAGCGYVVDSIASLMADGYGGPLAAILLTPAVVGEVGLAVWLLVKGVSVQRGRP